MSEKLQKILAQAGVGSRREMERWIEQGRVKLNGEIAKLGERAESSDELKVDGITIDHTSKTARRVLVYNKPEGEVCTRTDPEGRPTVLITYLN